MDARKFTTSIRIFDAVMFNEQLQPVLIDKHNIEVNPVAFGYLGKNLFLEAYFGKQLILFDFNLISTANNLKENKGYITATTKLDTVIFQRPKKEKNPPEPKK